MRAVFGAETGGSDGSFSAQVRFTRRPRGEAATQKRYLTATCRFQITSAAFYSVHCNLAPFD